MSYFQNSKYARYIGVFIGRAIGSTFTGTIACYLGPDYVVLAILSFVCDGGSVAHLCLEYIFLDEPDLKLRAAIGESKGSELAFWGTLLFHHKVEHRAHVLLLGFLVLLFLVHLVVVVGLWRVLITAGAQPERDILKFNKSPPLLRVSQLAFVYLATHYSHLEATYTTWRNVVLDRLVWGIDTVLIPKLATTWQRLGKQLRRNHRRRYKHVPLPARYIRLLKLDRKSPLGILRAKLVHVDIDDPNLPTYEAISYCWATATFDHEIELGNGRLDITATAYGALQDRTSIFRSRLVWIDSICIDQQNVSEKEDQVPLMAEVYNRASRVVVWLSHSQYARHGIRYIEDLLWKRSMDDTASVLRPSEQATPTDILALEALFGQAWFQRIWVIQEVVKAKKVHVLWGGQYIHWSLVYSISEVYSDTRTLGALRSSTTRGIARTRGTAKLKFAFDKGDRWPLPALLTHAVPWHATDPRDKVFGVQAMTSTATDCADLRPDYSSSAADIYRRVSRHFLLQGDCTYLLGFAGCLHGLDGRAKGPQELRLPSWAVDFSDELRARVMNYHKDIDITYKASGNLKSSIRDGPGPEFLRFGAIDVDCIATLTEPCPREQKDIDTLSVAIRVWVDAAKTVVASSGPLRYRELDDAFWRTLIGDRTLVKRPAGDYIAYLYEAFVSETTSATAISSGGTNNVLQSRRREFLSLLGMTSLHRRLCVTKGGYMGVVPQQAQVGDVIYLVPGAQTPFLLRPHPSYLDEMGEEIVWQIVQECYVHGIMDGELAGIDAIVEEILIG